MRRLALCLTLIFLVVATGPAWMQDAISPIPADALEILVRARSDLELLATNQLGRERPIGWSASLDVTDPQLAVYIRLDLELLAATLVGIETRPRGWFGAIPGTAFSIARDIRHDLELLADTIIATNQRPNNWAGDDPLLRCDLLTQDIVLLLEQSGAFTPFTSPERSDYCRAVAQEVTRYLAANLPGGAAAVASAPAAVGVDMAGVMPGLDDAYFADGTTAIAFLDRYATQRVGYIPPDVPFQVLARSYTQFSRMILVQGEGFLVFVDYRTTSVPAVVFAELPDINTAAYDTVCAASWCQSVVLTSGVGSGGGSRSPGGRQLVTPATNMVIYYDGGDADGTTLVRMELCGQPTSTGNAGCQPVTSVVGPDGANVPAAGSVGGRSQFRLPYGYSTHSARSRDYYTADIWINFP